jgi:hypothetical protein
MASLVESAEWNATKSCGSETTLRIDTRVADCMSLGDRADPVFAVSAAGQPTEQ